MKKVNYDELYENAYNKEWNGWKNLGEVMEEIESNGSRSWKYADSKVKHALNFLNGYLLEKRVKEKLHLEWNEDDHEELFAKGGEIGVPDFKDADGETYELKERWSFEDAMKCRWNGADHCLLHLKTDNTLYEYNPVLNCFDKICYLRASFVDIKRYPYTDKYLGL